MLQAICNKLLELDPTIHASLAPLHHKYIALICIEPQVPPVYATFEENKVLFSSNIPESINLSISARLIDFVYFALTNERQVLQVTGDAQLAAHLEKLYLQLNIDWEEELSKHTGDIIANRAIFCLRMLKNYLQSSSASISHMIVEYMQEEADLLPSSCEVEQFMHEVDELRLRVDRLDARIKAYESN